MLETHAFPREFAVFSPPLPVSKTPLQERVRQRFKTLVAERDVQHETLGKYLGLSRSAVTRLLNDEGSGIGLQHIERLCEFFQVTPSEVMAEPGALIAVLRPMEAAVVHTFRQMTELQRHSLLSVLDRSTSQPVTRRRAHAGRAELTDEQQLLVDLYARSNEQARAGILKTLRGTARSGDVERDRKRETSE